MMNSNNKLHISQILWCKNNSDIRYNNNMPSSALGFSVIDEQLFLIIVATQAIKYCHNIHLLIYEI